MLLSEDEVDFVQLVNTAAELSTFLVDDTQDPATTTSPRSSRSASATYGITQHGKGARLVSLISAYRRHLIPFLVEPAANRPSGQESVSPLAGVALTA